jgi:hypothetical protein
MTFKHKYPKYYKYKNPDPSAAKYAPIVTSELLQIIEEKISASIKRFYHIRSEAVLAIDLKHAVIRELSQKLDNKVVEIDKFERANSSDLRNYPWSEEESL